MQLHLPISTDVELLLFFGAGITLGGWIKSRISGWHTLAHSYAADKPFDDRIWRFRLVLLRRSVAHPHPMILNVGANRQGIYLKFWLLAPPFFPPLFIPWTDLTAKQSRFWFRGIELRVRNIQGLVLDVKGRAASEIIAEAGEQIDVSPTDTGG